jgi:ppGpp synthetase/RelA/SpoT-type nucleotidyltranferase
MSIERDPVPAERLIEIDALVQHYVENQALYRRFVKALHEQISDAIDPDNDHELSKLVHSVKYRLKTPEHLRKKLVRKHYQCETEGRPFPYTVENLFSKVGDLGGYRILHLHTRQFRSINEHLIPILEESHKVTEGPVAKVWDRETKEYFESIGVETEDNSRMYSSVHYLVQPSSKTTLTIEIQVRTLADEIWGEIDHKINYPDQHELLACREQIRALARLTSSCSRLVDSVMATHADWEELVKERLDPPRRKKKK